MVTRAEKTTPLSVTDTLFSDFFTNFDSHPVNHALAKVTNENAVKQSLRNLILTNLGERLFQPNIGSNILHALFEPNDIITAENITYFIKNTIKHNEPRVSVINVIVTPNPNADSFNVEIIFSMVNSNNVSTLDMILRRVR